MKDAAPSGLFSDVRNVGQTSFDVGVSVHNFAGAERNENRIGGGGDGVAKGESKGVFFRVEGCRGRLADRTGELDAEVRSQDDPVSGQGEGVERDPLWWDLVSEGGCATEQGESKEQRESMVHKVV